MDPRQDLCSMSQPGKQPGADGVSATLPAFYMPALCFCLGVLACMGTGAAGMAFASLVLPGSMGPVTAAAGLCLMALPLVALPAIFSGNTVWLPASGLCGLLACAAAATSLPEREHAFLLLLCFILYLAALGGTFTLARKTSARPPSVAYVRKMAVWSLIVALSFGLMAAGMLHEATVSERVTAAGFAVAGVTVLASFAAFFGAFRPGLFSAVIYLSLFLVWLIIPVAGMEAYMHAVGIDQGSVYAASDWKWTYAFCAVSGIAAIRLLILRQDLLRPRRPRPSNNPDL